MISPSAVSVARDDALGSGGPWVLAWGPHEASAIERAALRSYASGRDGSMVALATCRRFELFGVGEPIDLDDLAQESGTPVAVRGRLYEGRAAVERMMRIAAGLESAIVGEDEILRQVRATLATDERGDSVPRIDPALRRLIEMAIAVGRRARAVRPRLEHGFADRAIAWLETALGELAGRTVVVAGAGPIGVAAARGLARRGTAVIVASRDRERAAALASDVGGAARTLESVIADLGHADGLVVALAGPWAELASAPQPLPPLVDLSAPIAVPATVIATLEERFTDLDSLAAGGDGGRSTSAAVAAYREQAEVIVAAAVDDYEAWLASRRSLETITALRTRAERRRALRVARLFRRLPDLGEHERELIEQLSQQLVATILHEPSRRLRQDTGGGSATAARSLFDLVGHR